MRKYFNFNQIIKYIPKKTPKYDDKKIQEIFECGLNQNFWNKYIDFDLGKLLNSWLVLMRFITTKSVSRSRVYLRKYKAKFFQTNLFFLDLL